MRSSGEISPPAPAHMRFGFARQFAENDLLVAAKLVELPLQRRQERCGGRQLRLIAALAESLNQTTAADDSLIGVANAPLESLEVSICP